MILNLGQSTNSKNLFFKWLVLYRSFCLYFIYVWDTEIYVNIYMHMYSHMFMDCAWELRTPIQNMPLTSHSGVRASMWTTDLPLRKYLTIVSAKSGDWFKNKEIKCNQIIQMELLYFILSAVNIWITKPIRPVRQRLAHALEEKIFFIIFL